MSRADYMSEAQKRAVRDFEQKWYNGKTAPRTHANMLEATKAAGLHPVARPGKTAKDRARRSGG